jgi:hypothetical protein
MKEISILFIGITLLVLYVTNITSFFVIYYYNPNKHKNIELVGNINTIYLKQLFVVLMIYIMSIIVSFFISFVLGFLVFLVLTFLVMIVHNYIKKNMEKIKSIHCGIRPFVYIKFNDKIYNSLLMPVNNKIVLAIYIALIIGIILFIKYEK